MGGSYRGDDDVDVGVLRKDYEKLRRLWKKNRYIDKDFLVLLLGDKDYPSPYIKIMNKKKGM